MANDGDLLALARAAAFAPELAGATLHVDLRVLQGNWRRLRAEAVPAECGATIKGDAYGLGLDPCALALWAAGCRTYFVALPQEGVDLRRSLPEATIYVLDGLLEGTASAYVHHRLQPALASIAEIIEWAGEGRRLGRRLQAALHVDTGMHRLGLSPRDVEALSKRRPELGDMEITLVMSHLACADEPNAEMNEEQRQRFEALRRLLPQARASLANSPGSFFGGGFTLDLVRPGVALFGGNPFARRSNPMQPVAHLYGQILQVREVAEGESVGYAASWRAERASRIAVIAAGYRDGLPRSLGSPAISGPAHVFAAGQFAPIVGRVSMDTITVDVTDISPDFARRGAKVEIMGNHVTVDDLARWAGTIPYEILTSLGSRYARLYSPGRA